MIRSPKMKAITPPKLIPPFQSTAASGTFPTEQTKLIIATSGPITGPQNFAAVGWSTRKSVLPPRVGHPGGERAGDEQPDRDVAPDRRPVHHEVVRGRGEALRRAEPLPPRARRRRPTCPSRRGPPSSRRDPCSPGRAPRRPGGASGRRRKTIARMTIISGPPTNSPRTNSQPSRSAITIPSSTTRLVEAISNAIAAVKSAPRRKSERARATAAYEHDDDAAPSAGRAHERPRRSSGSSRCISLLRDDRLDDPRQREAEDQRPEDLPEHPERERERVDDLRPDIDADDHLLIKRNPERRSVVVSLSRSERGARCLVC